MAETIKRSRLAFLKLLAKLISSVLFMAGVLSSCYKSSNVVYGPPSALFVFGNVLSAEDSSSIEGIEIKLSNPDMSTVYNTTLSNNQYGFDIYMDGQSSPWPDSILVTATDIDGEDNGSFTAKDTLLLPDTNAEYQEFDVNFVLEETEEDN